MLLGHVKTYQGGNPALDHGSFPYRPSRISTELVRGLWMFTLRLSCRVRYSLSIVATEIFLRGAGESL